MSRVACSAVVALIFAIGCSDSSGPGSPKIDEPSSPFIVSNSHVAGSQASGGGSETDVAYVTLPPGAIPNASEVTIRVRRTGSEVTVLAVDGAVDPVPVRARQGDTLDVAVRTAGGTASSTFSIAVPGAARPIVVRTSPPPRKRDVPLNLTVVIVFSEPIAVPSVNSASVRLTSGATTVTGTLAFADQAHLTATFTPSTALSASTDYTLTVSDGVQDLDGQSLATPTSVTFTTAAAEIAVASIDLSPAAVVVEIGKSVLFTAQPRDANRNPLAGRTVLWSSSAPNVATVSAAGLVLGTGLGTAVITASVDGVTASSFATVVAPAGSEIAAGMCVEEYCGIYVVSANGFGGHFITTTPPTVAGESDPSWSPDGQRLAVQSSRHCQGATGACYSDIYTVNADGTGLRNITNTPNVDESTPAWSPDGARIAYSATTGEIPVGEYGTRNLNTMNPDGSDVRLLIRAAAGAALLVPAWSPDGERIAYSRVQDARWFIDVVNRDGTSPVQISKPTTATGDIMGSWSPDGKRIAFTRLWMRPTLSPDSDHCQVHVMNADGSDVRQLTADPFCSIGPAWSPDGSALVFQGQVGASRGLVVAAPDGTGGFLVARDGGFSRPAWSP